MQQDTVLRRAHDALAAYLPNDRVIDVLEAGGGSFTHIRVPGRRRVTVLDISPEQLERNDYADEKILGDLENAGSLKGPYDLIVCFDVLEHLPNPERAFANMASALREGGMLVIGCPNLASTKGLVTKLTPHGFHVWYYKAIRGDAQAGEPGHAPFPTFLRRAMGFDHLKRAAKAAGLDIVFARSYVGPAVDELKQKRPLLHALYDLPAKLARIATIGRVDLRDTDFVLVLRRPQQGPIGRSANDGTRAAAPATV